MTPLVSRLPLLVIVTTLVVLTVTGNFFSTSPAAVAVQIAAAALAIWSRRSFQAGTFRVIAAPAGAAIIRRGPYGFIRHPMYAAMLLFIWSGLLSHLSLVTLAIGLALTALVAARIVAEERLLKARFPDYAEYARSTNAVVPFIV